jgi:hypothetical protein
MPATAQDNVDRLEAALGKNTGVVEVVTDGVKVRYDRRQALDELSYWRRRLAAEQKRRPLFIGANLGGLF